MTTSTEQITAGYIKFMPDGAVEIIDSATVTDTYDFLQKEVGGHFDVVSSADPMGPLDSGLDFWVHDEGMFIYPVNPVGTAVITEEMGQYRQNFYGPIIVARHDKQGETVPLTATDIDELCKKHADAAALMRWI